MPEAFMKAAAAEHNPCRHNRYRDTPQKAETHTKPSNVPADLAKTCKKLEGLLNACEASLVSCHTFSSPLIQRNALATWYFEPTLAVRDNSGVSTRTTLRRTLRGACGWSSVDNRQSLFVHDLRGAAG